MKGSITMIQSWRLLTRLVYEQGSDGFLATPPLMSNCWNPAVCNSEKVMEAGVLPTRNGETEWPLCLGTPQGPVLL